jgi:hypothetical protein
LVNRQRQHKGAQEPFQGGGISFNHSPASPSGFTALHKPEDALDLNAERGNLLKRRRALLMSNHETFGYG